MHDRGLTEGHFIECFSLFLLTFPTLLPLPHTVHCQAGMLPPWPRQQAARGGICLASESFAATAEPGAVASKGPETLNFRAPLESAFSQPWGGQPFSSMPRRGRGCSQGWRQRVGRAQCLGCRMGLEALI